MNVISRCLLNIKFKNDDLLNKLTVEEKDNWIEKYHLVHRLMPISDRINPDKRKIVEEGLYNSLKNNKTRYISSYYLYYARMKISLREFIDRYDPGKVYKQLFNNRTEEELIEVLVDFVRYYQHRNFNKNPIIREKSTLTYLEDNSFIILHGIYLNLIEYKVFDSNEKKWFYDSVMSYLLAYFFMNDNLYYRVDYYQNIVCFLEDNIDYLYPYYATNFGDKINKIPEDLIEKYNNGKVIKKRIS